MVRNILIPLLICFVASSCDKGEIPVAPHEPGEVIIQEVELTPSYEWQKFYSLDNNKVVSSNSLMDWDIGFETGENGWHIIMNTARGAHAAKTNVTDLDQVKDTAGFEWIYDAQSGNLDSTAVGDYRKDNKVYIINRGYDTQGNHQGFCKVKFSSLDDEYSVTHSNLDGTDFREKTISKEGTTVFKSYSFDGGMVEHEPDANQWDLLFTRYMHHFKVPPQAYLVTGVLINRHNVSVAEDSIMAFEDINLKLAETLNFSNKLDVIGYDWKRFNFGTSSYDIHTYKNYVIKSVSGKYYKLHFIDFYNAKGEKGTPTFEVQAL